MGYIYLKKLTVELKRLGYGEEDLGSGTGDPCVVFWPTN